MTPFEQGYAAFLSGKPKDANPFGDATPWSANKWVDGMGYYTFVPVQQPGRS
jgi:hypothetical protein